MVEKIKHFLDSRYFVATALILVTFTSFFLGRISGLEERREPVRITTSSSLPNPNLGEGGSASSASGEVKGASTGSQIVASKSGSKYHYSWCPGAAQISEKNKIYFNSIEEARAAGYTPAGNCKGLK